MNENRSNPPTCGARPRLNRGGPAIGGELKCEIEDFEVEEIPAYEPDGDGPHHYLWIEKRNVDANTLLDVVADHFGVSRRDIGTAGNKDRRAITRQWVSIPVHDTDGKPEPEQIAEGVDILEVSRHRNKLRTGHLRGNRFRLRIRNTSLSGDELRKATEEAADRLREEGMPNYYGLQRFGDGGSTLEAGWDWVQHGDRPRSHFMQKMAASALQSEVFNRTLARRLVDGSWKTVVDGDIFEKTDTGGRFWIDESERAETQRRLDAKEIAVTGPMPGSEGGLADGEAGRLERRILEELGIAPEDLDVFGRRGRGTRRAMTVYPAELTAEIASDDTVELVFDLPAGSYATVLARELTG